MADDITRVSFGPVRWRRFVVSIWILALWAIGDAPDVVLLVGLACCARSLMTGLRLKGGRLVIDNFFRRRAVDADDVVSIRFRGRELSAIRRLVIQTKGGETLAVNGVSFWQFPVLLPWQRPEKQLHKLRCFLTRSNVADVYSSP